MTLLGGVLFNLAVLLPSAVAQFDGSGFGGYTPPTPRCPAFTCPKGQKPLFKEGFKVWAYGCPDSGTNFIDSSSLRDFDINNPLKGLAKRNTSKCCVEKEICHRTCGMTSQLCFDSYQSCIKKVCKADQNCLFSAQISDMTLGSPADDDDDKAEDGKDQFDPAKAACKAYGRDQKRACGCVDAEDWRPGVEARLRDFYAAYNPEKLDETGQIKEQDLEAIWKQWEGKEPQLFLELTKKYKDSAVEIRQKPKPKPPAPKEEAAKIEDPLQKEQQQLKDKLQGASGKKREKLEAEILELTKKRVAKLRKEKDDAVAVEDFVKAKELKHQIKLLDPNDEL